MGEGTRAGGRSVCTYGLDFYLCLSVCLSRIINREIGQKEKKREGSESVFCCICRMRRVRVTPARSVDASVSVCRRVA